MRQNITDKRAGQICPINRNYGWHGGFCLESANGRYEGRITNKKIFSNQDILGPKPHKKFGWTQKI